MKTTIPMFAAAAFGLAFLSPAAFAGHRLPIQKHQTSTATPAHRHLMPDSCMKGSCCGKRITAEPALGGRGSRGVFKRVKTCTEACPVAPADQRAVCGKGR